MNFPRRSKCFILGCERRNGKGRYKLNAEFHQHTSLFSVPRDPIQLAKWQEVVPKRERELMRGDVICQRHFAPDEVQTSFRTLVNTESGIDIFEMPRLRPALKKGSVPSIFPVLPTGTLPKMSRHYNRKPKPTEPESGGGSSRVGEQLVRPSVCTEPDLTVEPLLPVSELSNTSDSPAEPRILYLQFGDDGKPIIRSEPSSPVWWNEPIVSIQTDLAQPEWNEPVAETEPSLPPRVRDESFTFSDLKINWPLISLPSPLWGRHSGPNLVAFSYFSNELYDKGSLCEKGVVFEGNMKPKVMFHGIQVHMYFPCLNPMRQVTSVGCIEQIIKIVHLKRTCAGIKKKMHGKQNGRKEFSKHCRGVLNKNEIDKCLFCCKYESKMSMEKFN